MKFDEYQEKAAKYDLFDVTDDLKEVKKMLDAVLDDGVITPMESEKLIGLLKNVAPLAFEDDISAAKVSLV